MQSTGGLGVGAAAGDRVGAGVGFGVGAGAGNPVSGVIGAAVVGAVVGVLVGTLVGACVGACVGALVGVLVGTLVGDGVGHAALLHACVSAECGHATPPLTGAMSGTRLRDCEPVPHVLVHELQSDHGDITQFTGQYCVLQDLESRVAPHAAPP